jgi:DNA-binding NarL/FixJ family response regulator
MTIRESAIQPAREGVDSPDHAARPKVERVRVMVVDDHPLARRGVARLVDKDKRYEVIAEADDIGSALDAVEREHPDVLIVDITLKTGSGIDLIQRLRQRGDDVKIVVLSMHDESLYAEEALRAGATGYVNKSEAGDKILAAIERVLEGGVFLDPRFADQIVRRLATPSRSPMRSPVETLSDREREVFTMHGLGQSVREIAAELGLSPKTVETYRENIKRKLDLRGAPDLVRHAILWAQREAD